MVETKYFGDIGFRTIENKSKTNENEVRNSKSNNDPFPSASELERFVLTKRSSSPTIIQRSKIRNENADDLYRNDWIRRASIPASAQESSRLTRPASLDSAPKSQQLNKGNNGEMQWQAELDDILDKNRKYFEGKRFY